MTVYVSLKIVETQPKWHVDQDEPDCTGSTGRE